MASRVATTFAILFVCLIGNCSSYELKSDFYEKTCPGVFSIVTNVVEKAIAKEKRMGASLLRLHFHDCFVNGCDGSVLLDDTSSLKGEKTARPNKNSARGFEIIDRIKDAIESSCAACAGVVSCADILALAAKESVVQLGGSPWDVKLGRNDSLTANFTAANSGSIPAPTSNITTLIDSFRQHGLSQTDLVALSGAHTIGQAQCTSFRTRIYNDPNINTDFAKNAQDNCPQASGKGDKKLAPLDVQTPELFDNKYFGNLVERKGLLHSDQELYRGGSTKSLVKKYNKNPEDFMDAFAKAMIKMGDIRPPEGSQGEIRKHCRKANS